MNGKFLFFLVIIGLVAIGDARRGGKRPGGHGKSGEFFKLSSTTAECDVEAGSATIETGHFKDSKIFDGLNAGDDVAICVRRDSSSEWKKLTGTMTLVFKPNKS